jgi:hypothetical protein
VEAGAPLEALYADLGAEFARVLAPDGRAVLLTNAPHLLHLPGFARAREVEISLIGQNPTIAVFAGTAAPELPVVEA